jgi:hypothetical protein
VTVLVTAATRNGPTGEIARAIGEALIDRGVLAVGSAGIADAPHETPAR